MLEFEVQCFNHTIQPATVYKSVIILYMNRVKCLYCVIRGILYINMICVLHICTGISLTSTSLAKCGYIVIC